jgi:hypothetical protein
MKRPCPDIYGRRVRLCRFRLSHHHLAVVSFGPQIEAKPSKRNGSGPNFIETEMRNHCFARGAAQPPRELAVATNAADRCSESDGVAGRHQQTIFTVFEQRLGPQTANI